MFTPLKRTLAVSILTTFIGSTLHLPQAQAQGIPWMPVPGVRVGLSVPYKPAFLKGMVVHQDDALRFDFLIHQGDEPLPEVQKKDEYQKLIKYFMASLTVPDDNQWVNLSPFEKNRIIEKDFSQTEMGRNLLAQDYLLKQITASLVYPEEGLGKKFWDRVFTRAQQELGTTDIPMNTFNKVWVVPDRATVYEKNDTVYVLENHLKVMMEEDYLALEKNSSKVSLSATLNAQERVHQPSSVSSKVVREIIIPELEREVNEGKNFAPLRQIYSGMILAAWYKKALKESLLGKVYANQAKVNGVNIDDPKDNEKIYQQYLTAYKKGVFSLIKEDVDKLTNQPIPRKYFSGGAIGAKAYDKAMKVTSDSVMAGVDYAMAAPVLEAVQTAIQPDNAMSARQQLEDYVGQKYPKLQREMMSKIRNLADAIRKGKHTIRTAQESLDDFATLKGLLRGDAAMTVRDISNMAGFSTETQANRLNNLIRAIKEKYEGDSFLARLNKLKAEFRQGLTFQSVNSLGMDRIKLGYSNAINVETGAIIEIPTEAAKSVYIVTDGITTAGYDLLFYSPRKDLSVDTAMTVEAPKAFEVKTALQFAQVIAASLENTRFDRSVESINGLRTSWDTEIVGLRRSSRLVINPSIDIEAVKALLKVVPTADGLAKRVVLANTQPLTADQSYQGLVAQLARFIAQERVDNRYVLNLLIGATQADRRSMLLWLISSNSPFMHDGKSYPYYMLKDAANKLDLKYDSSRQAWQIVDAAMIQSNPNPVDQAMTNVGGIDLNAANLNMLIKRDGNGVPLPFSQQDPAMLNKIDGMVPVIIDIKPAMNLPILSELKNSGSDLRSLVAEGVASAS